MAPVLAKVGKMSLVVAILLTSVAFCVVGLLAPHQPMMVAGTSGPGGTTGTPVTAIDIQPSITPNPATVGELVTVGGTLSIVGGPSQVTFTITWPDPRGGSYEGSFTTVLDENGIYGIQTPPFQASRSPGTQSVTIHAEAGGVSDTETITFTVLPAP